MVRDRVALVCILRTQNVIFNSGLYNDAQNTSAVLTAWTMKHWGGVLCLAALWACCVWRRGSHAGLVGIQVTWYAFGSSRID